MEMEASKYLYGHPTSEFLHIDDLLDFSNDEIFDADTNTHLSLPDSAAGNRSSVGNENDELYRSNFSVELCVPSDDAAELEWLSKFMEDSFSEFPYSAGGNNFPGNTNFRPDPSVPAKARSKRSKASVINNIWTISEPFSSSTVLDIPAVPLPLSGKPKGGTKKKDVVASVSGEFGRKCTHCLTEKTPQWRTGPMGPKTLCNACGVRYKSGRLVPEYRPASSPTFMLTQHSNSHRKVMELRRQKEIGGQENQSEFFHDFEVC